jgi:hypothetical protein
MRHFIHFLKVESQNGINFRKTYDANQRIVFEGDESVGVSARDVPEGTF